MNTMLLLQYGIPAVVGVVSALAGHWMGKRSGKSAAPVVAGKPPAVHLPGNLGTLASDPVVQIVLSKLFKAAHDSGHAALDAAVTKLMPGLAPALPVLNEIVDAAESKMVKQ